ncbi:hypothetical protein FXO37_09839 [Capsicum annuum]|nr:hypothetical protein FXO37_09839 [Capsicum annuum]
MISGFITGYEINVVEFLSREMRDRVVRGEKSLLDYHCLITQICMAIGVVEVPGIYEMIEAMRTTDLVLIKDVESPLAQHARQKEDWMTEVITKLATLKAKIRGGQTLDITEVKTEMDETKWMVHELYNSSVILKHMIKIVVPTIYVSNIWVIPEPRVVETEDERQARKKRKHDEKDNRMKA